MKIAALKEQALGETRVAITPDIAKLFVKKGFTVCVEHDIGSSIGFSNQSYVEAGAKVLAEPMEVLSDADIILKVQPSLQSGDASEIKLAKSGAIVVGLLSPYNNSDYITSLAKSNLVGVAMEFVPRLTKTQNMDVLSSQSNLAGYRAVIEASYHFDRAFPMMMTAAGTVIAAKLLVLGAGVAGLQAIATAKRLGAVVSAYDVRSATKEQVESLGAKFVSPETKVDLEEKSGYAKSLSEDSQSQQDKFLASIIKNYDIVITTAQIPGKNAPRLISYDMVKLMKEGSVIVDMATSSGGNVEGAQKDEVIITSGVKIIGWSNLASRVASDSSKLYAKNLYNFLEYAIKDNKFNFEDEVVQQMLLTKDSKVVKAL